MTSPPEPIELRLLLFVDRDGRPRVRISRPDDPTVADVVCVPDYALRVIGFVLGHHEGQARARKEPT